ncbi:hypothetical protein C8R44DRAFT_870677 [Mycena epipterygia]|nr:hypothetical protein C8R44DRAFT_870677 [Mycena epipterygia]
MSVVNTISLVRRGLCHATIEGHLMGYPLEMCAPYQGQIKSLVNTHFYHILLASNTCTNTLLDLMELRPEEWAGIVDFEKWLGILIAEIRNLYRWIDSYENGWPVQIALERLRHEDTNQLITLRVQPRHGPRFPVHPISPNPTLVPTAMYPIAQYDMARLQKGEFHLSFDNVLISMIPTAQYDMACLQKGEIYFALDYVFVLRNRVYGLAAAAEKTDRLGIDDPDDEMPELVPLDNDDEVILEPLNTSDTPVRHCTYCHPCSAPVHRAKL